MSCSVNVVGAFKGPITLPEGHDTVKDLREAIARALGLPLTAAPSLKLIVSGKTLRDDDSKLCDEGALSRAVLVLRGAVESGGSGGNGNGAETPLAAAASAAAALDARLEALRAAADRLVSSSSSSSSSTSSGRGRGGGGGRRGELVLEASDGSGGDALAGLTDGEKKAIKLALALAAKGKETLERACRSPSPPPGGDDAASNARASSSSSSSSSSQRARQRRRRIASEALAELDVASQAMSLVVGGDGGGNGSAASSSSVARLLRRADNVALLHLDWAWAAYLAGEPSRLAAATGRLREARRALEASHGADRSRARAAAFLGGGGGGRNSAINSTNDGVVNGGPEAALYVRLDLLEGIAAAASGTPAREAAASLERAARGWKAWQCLPEGEDGVAALTSMGFSRAEARRALRFVGGSGGSGSGGNAGGSFSLDAAAAAAVDLRRAAREREDTFAEERRARSAARRFEKYHAASARGASSSSTTTSRIDVDVVLRLMKLGYEPELAAAAVALSGGGGGGGNDVGGGRNSYQSAADALADVERNLVLQAAVEQASEERRKRKRRRREEAEAQAAAAAAAGLARSDDDNDDDDESDGDGNDGNDGDDGTNNNAEARAAERSLLRSLEATRSSDPLSAYLDVELDLEGAALVTWLRRLGRAEVAEELKRAGAREEEEEEGGGGGGGG